MSATKRFMAMLLCLSLCAPMALAQQAPDKQREAQATTPISQDVTIIIQQEKVRFTAQQAVQEMRLQITDQTGELVYDSGPTTGPEINWPLQNAQGEALKSGLYAYALSLKQAGAETARVRRGHFIVDRARERDGQTDRLWVTSQGESGVGTELTVARSEEATIAGTSTISNRSNQTGRDTAGRDVERTAETKEGKGAEQAAKADAVAAAAGTAGQIAKFTSATDLGNSVISEQNGNIGIGTASPHHRLSISGGPSWTANGWRGSLELDNASAIGWQANAAGQRFGLGHTGGGLYFFRTNSDPGTTGTPANYDLVINDAGNVGIGTTALTPSRLTVEGQDALTVRGYEPFLTLKDSNDFFFQNSHRIQSAHGDLNFFQGFLQYGGGGLNATREYVYTPRMVIKDGGNVGIGTASPNHQLSLGRGPAWTRNGWGGAVELQNGSAIGWQTNAAGQRFGIGHTDGGLYFFRTASDPATTGAPADYDLSISDTGVVSVKVLQINGGSDFSESFDVDATTGSEAVAKVEPGLVVSIDPAHPGKLQLSAQAYDRRVAGIISGAGGVKPGMMMSQPGTLADGQHPVALSGRVYCWVDASPGAIEPGDLLTTSSTPGHAMKVTDPAKAQGAIIGKAMTGLKEGKGLVLVLVTLQ